MSDRLMIPTSPVDEAIRELPVRNENSNEPIDNSKSTFNTITTSAKHLLNTVNFWGGRHGEPTISITKLIDPVAECTDDAMVKDTGLLGDGIGPDRAELRRAKSSEQLCGIREHRREPSGGDVKSRKSLAGPLENKVMQLPKGEMEFVKTRCKAKPTRDFDKLFLSQILMINGVDSTAASEKADHNGPTSKPNAIWTFCFSKDGEYLATGGQDGVIRVWGLRLLSQDENSNLETSKQAREKGFIENFPVFTTKPVRVYTGHTKDVLDLSWSKTGFLLSSSTDKTVKLWHIKLNECLCTYQHMDFVTSVMFHPKNDRYFLSGSLDCRIRLWNIPEKKVAHWAELPDGNLVTAVGFSADGKVAIAGSYHGLCMLFDTDGLKFKSQITVKSGAKTRAVVARKITGIEAIPDPNVEGGKIMVTSNDSRIRIYNLKDLSLDQKFKGPENNSNQIKASFSDDLRFITCGSENRQIYLFNLSSPLDNIDPTHQKKNFLGFKKKDESVGYETVEAHSQIVTVTCLAPTLTKKAMALMSDPLFNPDNNPIHTPTVTAAMQDGHILVSADYFGNLKVFRRNTLDQPFTPSFRSLPPDDASSISKFGRISRELTRSLRRERKGSESSFRSGRSTIQSSIDPSNRTSRTPTPPESLHLTPCSECNTVGKLIQYLAQPILLQEPNLPQSRPMSQLAALIPAQPNDLNLNMIRVPYDNNSTTSLPTPARLPQNAKMFYTSQPASPVQLHHLQDTTLTICLQCRKVLAGL